MTNRIFDMLSVSGAEDKMRIFITDCIGSLFDSVKTDNMGNLILHKSGSGDRLCIECGMDSRGIMIVSAEEGKARFSAVGQLKADFLDGKKVLMEDGSLGIIRLDGKVSDSTSISELYLETENTPEIGDFGVVCPDFTETDKSYYANCLSDVIGMAAVLEAVLESDINCDLTLVFSAQKSLNGRGLRAYFDAYSFDKVFTVCGCECDSGVKSGNGCVLILKDKTAVASSSLKEEVLSLDGIKIQPLVSSENHYLGSIVHGGEGNPCIALGVPVLHRGKNLEATEKCDFDAAVELICKLIG